MEVVESIFGIGNSQDAITSVPMEVSGVSLNYAIQELRKDLQDVSSTLETIGNRSHLTSTADHFLDVMEHFIAEATDEIQSMFRMQASTMEEFAALVTYFGEDPRLVTTTDIFSIFYDFVEKFEKAHRHNMMYKRH